MGRVSQATFDDVVRENIVDFGMDKEEAIADAITQFTAQGVDLTGIVTVPTAGTSSEHPVIVAITALRESIKLKDEPSISQSLVSLKASITSDADVGIAGAHGGVESIAMGLDLVFAEPSACILALDALTACLNAPKTMPENRDRLAMIGVNIVYKAMTNNLENECVVQSSLSTIKTACIRQENNRQWFVNAGLIDTLVTCVKKYGATPTTLRLMCAVIRVLMLRDDERAPESRGFDHGKTMAMDGVMDALIDSFARLAVMKSGAGGEGDSVDDGGDVDDAAMTKPVVGQSVNIPALLGDICGTISKLAVDSEVCNKFLERDALSLVTAALAQYMHRPFYSRNACMLLRAVAGTDACRKVIIEGDGQTLVLSVFKMHALDAAVVEQCLFAIAAFALRQPDNCAKLCATDGCFKRIVGSLKTHDGVEGVCRQASIAIRNLVGRNPENRQPLLDLGCEELLRAAGERHSYCSEVAKAALRDLGCHVHLEERWKGTGFQLQQ